MCYFALTIELEEMLLLAAETLLGGCTIANKCAQNIAADPIYIHFLRTVFSAYLEFKPVNFK